VSSYEPRKLNYHDAVGCPHESGSAKEQVMSKLDTLQVILETGSATSCQFVRSTRLKYRRSVKVQVINILLEYNLKYFSECLLT